MLTYKGYYIEQLVNNNKIIIGLPQTIHTPQDSVSPVSNRRLTLTEEELAVLLQIVVQQYEAKEWE